MKMIEIIVSPQGDTRVETKGFSGSDCQAASQFIEASLGLQCSEQLTKEFYQAAKQNRSTQQRH